MIEYLDNIFVLICLVILIYIFIKSWKPIREMNRYHKRFEEAVKKSELFKDKGK